MKYAVIQFGGKQFNIKEGETFQVEHQETFKPIVLAYSDGKSLTFGTPNLDDITVKLSVVNQFRGKKIRVGRFKSKSRYHKIKGHKQPYTLVRVDSIKKADEVEVKEIKEVKAVKKAAVKKPAKKVLLKKVKKGIK